MGVTFHVPYRFFWNGHERLAESIVLTEVEPGEAAPKARRKTAPRGVYEVRAFFLFGEIRDRISADQWGVTVRRTWAVRTVGSLRLSVDLELDPGRDPRFLFPGVHAARGMPAGPASVLGEKTSYPSAVLLSLGTRGVLVFSRTALSGKESASIGVSTSVQEDEPSRLRVQMRFPGVEEPAGRVGPGPDHLSAAAEAEIESDGSLERTHEMFLSFAPTDRIVAEGGRAAAGRLLPGSEPPGAETIDTGALADALRAALSSHLYQSGGAVGMRETRGSPWISCTAGVGVAVALRRLFPGDARLRELSLRLADFALKGQLASGFFHESYSLDARAWRGVRGETTRTVLSTRQSSRIAELLLRLAADLADAGLPHQKYYLAAVRFVEFFLDEKGRLSMPGALYLPGEREPMQERGASLEGMELFFPLAALRVWTGRDRYKKPLDEMVKRFSALPWDAFSPPGAREGRGPDAVGAMLAVRLFARMRELKYRPAEAPVSTAAAAAARASEAARLFASLLVPWVRIRAEGHEARSSGPPGCLVESFARQRLLFAGNQAALGLLQLADLTPDKDGAGLLRTLAGQCLSSSRFAAPGAAFFQHTDWDESGKPGAGRGKHGPVDSRRLADEVLAGLEITRRAEA
jgi:hypothetical protein